MRLYWMILFWSLFQVACEKSSEQYALSRFPEFDLQGHRGARGLLPENTIPSLKKALEYGVTTLEFDVVVSADQQIVLSHEPWFNAVITTGPSGERFTVQEGESLNMYKMTLKEIQSYDVGRLGHPTFPEQKSMSATKPSLREAIQEVETWRIQNRLPEVLFNIETKSRPEWYGIYVPEPKDFAKLLYTELKALKIIHRTVIQSFDVNTLMAFRALNEDIPLALLVANEDGIETNLDHLGFTPAIYSPYYKLLDAKEITRIKQKGMYVIPWTVNEVSDMLQLISWGVDGLITDYPNRFSFDWLR